MNSLKPMLLSLSVVTKMSTDFLDFTLTVAQYVLCCVLTINKLCQLTKKNTCRSMLLTHLNKSDCLITDADRPVGTFRIKIEQTSVISGPVAYRTLTSSPI